MSDSQPQNGSVFISYSRKDKEFVRTLHEGLVSQNVKVWVDWEGIPLSADWMDEITRAIDGADAFIVVISPDWLASQVCAQEYELGLKQNKKLVPVLYRMPEKGTPLPEKLAATNWVYMRPEDDFAATLPKLVDAINTDLDWVRQHTRLIQRATEWDKKSRNASFLLHGTDLEEGEGWMNQAAMNTNRQVLPLQADYIIISRKEAVRRQRMATIAISLAMVVSLVLAVLAVFQWVRANENAQLAKESEAVALAAEKVAKENEQLAKDNEQLAKENELKAKASEAKAKENETIAKAERNAAEARLYQEKAGELDVSTLLALFSWETFPSLQAEDIIRQNLSYMPLPISKQSQALTGAADSQVTNIEFNPDATAFATNGYDGQACVWEAGGSAEKQFCVTHGTNVADAVFTSDGIQLVTGGDDGYVRFWDASDGKPGQSQAFGGAILDLEVSPDGKWLAVARADNSFSVINLLDPTAKQFNIQRDSAINVVKISPDSKWLVAGADSGKTSIILLGSNFPILGPDHGKAVLSIAFSPDSSRFVSAGADSKARLAKTESGRQLLEMSHGDWAENVVFSPNGQWILVAADDNRVWLWDAQTGLPKFRLLHDGFVLKVRFSPDGNWIASTGTDKTLRLWDVASGSKVLEAALDNSGSGLSYSPDGKQVIVGDRSGVVSIWDVSFLSSRVGYIEFPEYISDVKLAPSGEWLVANTADFNIWGLESAALLETNLGTDGKSLFKSSDLTYSLEISPDSNWVAVVETNRQQAILYDYGQKTKQLLVHGSLVTDVAFTPDSQLVATSGKDSKVILWNVKTGERQAELQNAAPVLSVGISRDGKYLVAGQEGRAATTVWDLSNFAKVAELTQAGNVTQIAFSADGKWVATGDDLGVVALWDAKSLPGATPARKLEQNGDIASLAFSPDSRWLLTGSSDGFVRIWDISTGDELARIPHADAVTGLEFGAGGKYLLTVSRKVLQIWDLPAIPLVPKSNLFDAACGHLVTNLSMTQWETIFTNEQYQLICPALPQGLD